MPTYTPADQEAEDLFHVVLQEYHPDLAEAGVTWSLLYAFARQDPEGNPAGPALKLHGQAALAIVKINSVQQRTEGLADCTIRLDGDAWKEHSEETKRAILDHEAEHVCVVRDDAGAVQTDDAGRPKLRTREHDLVVGGFRSVVDRHRQNAVESRQFLEAHREFHQRAFPWG